MRRLAFALVAVTFAACANPDGYRAAVDPVRSEVVAAVRDYYTLRNQLTAGLGIEEFWRTYPELSYSHELGTGINLDVLLWKWSHDPDLARRNYRTDLESHEPIRVFVRANEALAFVHGTERWEPRGGETIGEFRTVLTLRRSDGTWTIVKTDEQMLGERPATDPPH